MAKRSTIGARRRADCLSADALVFLPRMTREAIPAIFDRTLYRRRRERSAARLAAHDFLHQRAMADIVDRLETVTRSFEHCLLYGAKDLASMLTPSCGVRSMIFADLAPGRIAGEKPAIAFDEEYAPFAPQSFDLIVSVLTLHALNDLVGALIQMRQALKPDGLLIAVLFAEDTLRDVKSAFLSAESEFGGGASPRIAPFASVRDLGGALQRAGFVLPVVDVDRVDVAYSSPQRLIDDLRGMGETNCLQNRSAVLARGPAGAALSLIAETATIRFDLATLTAWAPQSPNRKD